MEFWERTPDMIAWIKKERDYLLGINDNDALKLSHSEQYQRNKYLGEIESHKWLLEVQRKQAIRIAENNERQKQNNHFARRKSE